MLLLHLSTTAKKDRVRSIHQDAASGEALIRMEGLAVVRRGFRRAGLLLIYIDLGLPIGGGGRLAQQPLSCLLVAPALDQDVEHDAGLVHGSPKPMPFPLSCLLQAETVLALNARGIPSEAQHRDVAARLKNYHGRSGSKAEDTRSRLSKLPLA
jgi:hypothetical protein